MAQSVDHTLPKLTGWVWFPVGHNKDSINGTCSLSSLHVGINGWENRSSMLLSLIHHQHSLWKIVAWPLAQASEDRRRRPLVTCFFRWDISVMFLLRPFGHWDISVICLKVVSKFDVTVFISLYFQTFWPKLLNFFGHFKHILTYDRKNSLWKHQK